MSEDYIPNSLQELTPEWLTEALRERALLSDGTRVVSARQEPLGEGEGFVGVIARLHMEYDRPEERAPRTVIAKMPHPLKYNRIMGELLGCYEREILFYEELAPQVPMRMPTCYYGALDRDRGSEQQEQILGTVDRMPFWLLKIVLPVSRWIVSRKKRRYALLIEDIDGARMGDQVSGGSTEDLKLAVEAIAPMHAAMWQSNQLEGRFYLTRHDLNTRMRHFMYMDSRKRFVERYEPLMARGLGPLVDWLDRNGETLCRRLHSESPATLLHGDFRFDNVFFADGSDKDPVITIDFQLVSRGCCAYDVAYLLSGAADPDMDRETEDALLRAYHAKLVESGVTNYDFSRLRRDYELSLLVVLQTIATTDSTELGADRGIDLIDLWIERLLGRAKTIDLRALDALPKA